MGVFTFFRKCKLAPAGRGSDTQQRAPLLLGRSLDLMKTWKGRILANLSCRQAAACLFLRLHVCMGPVKAHDRLKARIVGFTFLLQRSARKRADSTCIECGRNVVD